MTQMLADQLKALWAEVDRKTITWERFEEQKKQWLEGYASQWRDALRIGGQDLKESSLNELMGYLKLPDRGALETWHQRAEKALSGSWNSIDTNDPQSVERFYDQCQLELYNLLTWHTLAEDDSPLAYVAALEFARPHHFKTYLDFGSGVGSGGILFARNGYDVTLADVSSPLLNFARWRHEQRDLPVQTIDLKSGSLPKNRFDFVTAMDVFEHLVDPVKTAEQIVDSLTAGGILFGRFHVEPNDTHITHIVKDFAPTFSRMNEMGMKAVWKDEWLWGHQAFQKS